MSPHPFLMTEHSKLYQVPPPRFALPATIIAYAAMMLENMWLLVMLSVTESTKACGLAYVLLLLLINLPSVPFIIHFLLPPFFLPLSPFLLQDTHAPLPPPQGAVLVDGCVIFNRVLGFLSNMLKDLAAIQARRKAASLDPALHSVSCIVNNCICVHVCAIRSSDLFPVALLSPSFCPLQEPHINAEGLSLSKIWDLYIPLTLQYVNILINNSLHLYPCHYVLQFMFICPYQ